MSDHACSLSLVALAGLVAISVVLTARGAEAPLSPLEALRAEMLPQAHVSGQALHAAALDSRMGDAEARASAANAALQACNVGLDAFTRNASDCHAASSKMTASSIVRIFEAEQRAQAAERRAALAEARVRANETLVSEALTAKERVAELGARLAAAEARAAAADTRAAAAETRLAAVEVEARASAQAAQADGKRACPSLPAKPAGGEAPKQQSQPQSTCPSPEFTSNAAYGRLAMLRELTGTCDPAYPYVDALVNGPVGSVGVGPENAALPLCTEAQFAAALRRAVRPEMDGPLYVDGCRLTWFTRAVACDLVERLGILVVSGDSLTRQIGQGMLMILTGDYRTGAVLHLPGEYRNTCQCDLQLWDRAHFCRINSSVYWDEIALTAPRKEGSTQQRWMDWDNRQDLICPFWTDPHFMFNDGYMRVLSDTIPRAAHRSTNGKVTAFVGMGLHHAIHEDPVAAVHFGYDELLDSVRMVRGGGKQVRLIGNTMHMPGDNVFEVAREKSNPDTVRRYNDVQRRFFMDSGMSIFESYRLSMNAPSADGQHVFVRTNVVMAQLLLNHIAAMLRDEEALPQPQLTLDEPPWQACDGSISAHVGYAPFTNPRSRVPAAYGHSFENHSWWCKFYVDLFQYSGRWPTVMNEPKPVAWPPP